MGEGVRKEEPKAARAWIESVPEKSNGDVRLLEWKFCLLVAECE